MIIKKKAKKTPAVVVDSSKCIGCGLCVKDCVGSCLEIADGKAVFQETRCIGCGHCYAICPQKAIDMPHLDTEGCDDYVPMTDFDSDKLLTAMKSRRTIRQFQSRPVEQFKIDKIIEAGRFCQTAANHQNIAYTILGSKQDEFEAECVKVFRTAVQAGGKLVKAYDGFEIPDDFFFKGAPLVIVVSGSNSNKGLATSYMELMADSLGLGVLISGFAETVIAMNPKVKRMLDLPKKHKVLSVMVIGYPAVEYQRIAPRKQANVKVL